MVAVCVGFCGISRSVFTDRGLGYERALRFRISGSERAEGPTDILRAVFKDFVPHPEPVHSAVYAVIVLGSVIAFTVVCPIGCLSRFFGVGFTRLADHLAQILCAQATLSLVRGAIQAFWNEVYFLPKALDENVTKLHTPQSMQSSPSVLGNKQFLEVSSIRCGSRWDTIEKDVKATTSALQPSVATTSSFSCPLS